MNTYYSSSSPDPVLRETYVTCLDRLKMALNNKPYYSDDALKVYLDENGLSYSADYNKDKDYKNLLQATYDVLEALYNDIDSFRNISTEFSNTSSAAKHLSDRLDALQKKINAIPDSSDEGKQKSIFTHMFRTN